MPFLFLSPERREKGETESAEQRTCVTDRVKRLEVESGGPQVHGHLFHKKEILSDKNKRDTGSCGQ
jgi:hypothetical protein